MGDLHNLFGRVHEADVALRDDGTTEVLAVRPGERAIDTLAGFGYSKGELVESISSGLRERVEQGELSQEEALGLLEDYRDRLGHYTYLD
jgi:arginine decarboxylase-like protein